MLRLILLVTLVALFTTSTESKPLCIVKRWGGPCIEQPTPTPTTKTTEGSFNRNIYIYIYLFLLY